MSGRSSLSIALLALCCACRSQPPESTGQPGPAVPSAPATSASTAAPVASAAPDAAAPDASAVEAAEPPLEGAAFPEALSLVYRIAACGGSAPPNYDPKVIEAHCGMLKGAYAEYTREWLDVARPFLAKLRPAGLPNVVVYPFGGGDLVTALATYPDATEITTISLERAGDVRGILKASTPTLGRELATLRDHLAKLFLKAHSRTVNLDRGSRGAIPSEIAFTMAALVVHGYEPITIRYFDFQPDGSLRWLSEADLSGAGGKDTKDPFTHAEIRFRKPGGPVRVFRHVAYDLSDAHLKRSPALMKHLDAKGKVSTMTKAASHLLWDDGFTTLRNWLLAHTDWMISDTTGVPPRHAKAAGFVQETYGMYVWPEPFGTVNNRDARDFKELFKGNAPIPFRYGYPDNRSHGHIVVTKRAAKAP